jgi:hypothetical protein
MSVLPFTSRMSPSDDGRTEYSAAPDVTGSVRSRLGGGDVSFRGTYRIERLLEQYGLPAAAGVFTGELSDANGNRIGLASRRHTAAVRLLDGTEGPLVSLGPVDVNLLGFLVTVDAFSVLVSRLPFAGSSSLVTAAELFGRVVKPYGGSGRGV